MSPQSTTPGNAAKNDARQDNSEEDFHDGIRMGQILANPPEGEEVVISGIAGQFPNSDSVHHFRDNLFNKVDMVTDDTKRWEHTHPEIPKRGGKLNNITKFDAGYFGVYYKQAHAMCPMARLCMESAVECIMDAGLHPSELEGANCGVFIGSCFSETEKTWFYDSLKPQYSPITGCERSMIANRISYFLKLNGPCYITDTACSSSLSALENAYRLIRIGQIDCAIVGGTNVTLHPFVSLQFARLSVLSADGACKSFDAEGSGYARSEAICCVFLQKAKDSKRIYCQIMHAKINCDGYKPQGITYPSGEVQRCLLREFYRECKVDPSHLDYLEAHGTGTKVGDPEECGAVDDVFCRNRTGPFLIGSVKSNIGHAEPASGLCSIAKAVITLDSGCIPPNLHYKKPREGVEPLEKGRLKVVTEKTYFTHDNVLMGVNSFGFGGGNAHVLLRQHTKKKSNNTPQDDLPRLVCVSGRTEQGIATVLDSVKSGYDPEYMRLLQDVFKKHIPGYPYRGYSIISKNGEIKRDAQYFTEQVPDLYLLFGGVEECWRSFGKHLFTVPVFVAAIQRIHDIMAKKGINITEILLNGDKTAPVCNNILGSVVVQIAIIDVMNHVGVEPNGVMGDSLGELICAYYDGVLSLEETLLSAVVIHNDLVPISQPLVQCRVKLDVRQLRAVMPANVEFVSEISKRQVLIAGPEESIGNFVNSLRTKNVYVENAVVSATPFMKRDFEIIRSQLAQQLKQIIISPKNGNGKWLRFSNKASLVDYLVQSLANPSRYNHFIRTIPVQAVLFEVGCGSTSQVLQDQLSDKKISPVYFSKYEKQYDFVALLDTLGRLHNHGYNFRLEKLYPEIHYPVSRGTPMLSPHIKWEHDNDWFVLTYKFERNVKSSARLVVMTPVENEWKFVQGHLVDGRLLFPASGYLILVWETLAVIRGSLPDNLPVVFENIKFKRATQIRDGMTEFTVMIQRGSGNFEIIEGGTDIVSGKVSLMGSEDPVDMPHYRNDDPIKMTTKDVYKELRLRGYNYKGSFRAITETNVAADRGLIRWDANWITFIDNMFQLRILNFDTRFLYVPTGIDRLTIDSPYHLQLAQDLGEKPKIPVHFHQHCDIIKAGGVEVRALKASAIPRRKPRGEPVLEKYVFVPNEIEVDIPLSVRLNMQICLENTMGVKVKAVEVIDECTKEDSEPLAPHILTALGDLPLIQPTIKLLTKKEITIPNVTVEDVKLNTETECLLVVGSNMLRRPQVLHAAFGALKDDQSFIISREERNFDPTRRDLSGVSVLTVHRTDKEALVMLKKSPEYRRPLAVDVADPEQEFAWMAGLQEAVANDGDVVVYSQKAPLSGVLGLANCLRREPGGAGVRAVYVTDPQAPPFDLDDPFYVRQLQKSMAVNVFEDGRWGTYRHLLLDAPEEIESEHCFSNVLTKGDISSMRWICGPLTVDEELPMQMKLVQIYNTSLNFRDVMIASGRISADFITLNRLEQDCAQGFEFSGRTMDGKRVMGMTTRMAVANMVAADCYLLYEVPDAWTLKQGATVVVVYSTVLSAFLDIANIQPGQSVLIHSGAGGVGQAAINIALYHGLKVYTTCGSEGKRAYLKKCFPQLTDNVIGNSHDNSFEQMIMRETEGRGVDIVLNSLAEEKLMTSIRCLTDGGKFLEIGKFDLARNTGLQVALLQKNCSFHSVMLDSVFNAPPEMKRHLRTLLTEGIKAGYVRPLQTHVFKSDEVEKAFRFMASGKHMGKVIINLREEEREKVVVPRSMPMMGVPRYICTERNSYVICGGLGGFGLELADWMVQRGARRLMLTSRNGVKTGYQASRIRLWKSYGVDVRVSTADITTLAGCEQMLKEAEALGPVGAIFNLAVVLKDALFTNQTVEMFKESFGPKARATKHLDEASRKLCPNLKDFVIFSSVSCGRGNPGQTNYGMANSIMERICEKRRKEGLPALAIEWGAIGDVGLVAELQEEHTELEIGGTLQQRISSCLEVMDHFLKQNHPVVGSMVVAEKRAGIAGADNVVDAVANILGLTDLKTVSMHVTLAELGMDSMTAVEIKQSLEREFEVFLTSQDIRSLTFARLHEIEAERENEAEKGKKVERLPSGIELILRLWGDEATANIPIMRLPSRIEEGKPGAKVLLLPGVEGVAKSVSPLSKNMNCHAHVIQFCHDKPGDTPNEIAQNLLPQFESLLSKTQPFTIASYSYGSIIALEVVALLEQKGYAGTLILIDGSPKMLCEMVRQQVASETEDQFQTNLLCILMSLYMPTEIILKNREKLYKANGFEERIKVVRECSPKDGPYSPEYLRVTALGIYKRIKSVVKYTPSFAKIKSTVKLCKPSQISVHDIPDDYNLSQLCENPVDVKTYDGNHITILENKQLADAICAVASSESVFVKKALLENGTEMVEKTLIEVKHI